MIHCHWFIGPLKNRFEIEFNNHNHYLSLDHYFMQNFKIKGPMIHCHWFIGPLKNRFSSELSVLHYF